MQHEPGPDPLWMPGAEPGASHTDEVVDAEALLEPSVADEPLFHEVWEKVRALESKSPRRGGGTMLLVTAVLFALSFRVLKVDTVTVVVLLAVVFIHEMGHLAAMKVFGYTDLKILFIPFVGGAAAGKKRGGPGWQQGIVLLAGPLPGILLALPLCLAGEALELPQEWVRLAAIMFLGLNLFNLLPFEPLDGGRLLQLTLFSRHPLLELLFRLMAVAGLGLLALVFGWLLGVIALFMLITLPMSYRRARQRIELRAVRPDMPVEMTDLDDDDRRELFESARCVFRFADGREPKGYAQGLANIIRQLHTEVVTRPPGVVATILLLGTWAGSLVTGIVLSVILAFQLKPEVPPGRRPPPRPDGKSDSAPFGEDQLVTDIAPSGIAWGRIDDEFYNRLSRATLQRFA